VEKRAGEGFRGISLEKAQKTGDPGGKRGCNSSQTWEERVDKTFLLQKKPWRGMAYRSYVLGDQSHIMVNKKGLSVIGNRGFRQGKLLLACGGDIDR